MYFLIIGIARTIFSLASSVIASFLGVATFLERGRLIRLKAKKIPYSISCEGLLMRLSSAYCKAKRMIACLGRITSSSSTLHYYIAQ